MMLGYSDFKNFVTFRGLSAQRISANGNYYLKAFDGFFDVECVLNTSQQLDEVADYNANLMTGENKSLVPAYDGSYNLPIIVNPSILTTNTYFWAMRNKTTGNRMFLQKIVLTMTYGGLTGSATPSKFSFKRFSGATPSGGSTITEIKSDTTFPGSNLLDARESDSGLTVTGLTIENPVLPFSVVSQLATSTTVNLLFPLEHEFTLLCLNPGEGLIFAAASSLLSGVTITGFIEWVERT